MKLEEVMVLSEKELRIRAAELLGYDRVEDVGKGVLIGWLDDGSMAHADIPDYPNDIEAVMELETSLLETSLERPIEDKILISPELEAKVGVRTGYKRFREGHPVARYIDALGQVLGIDLASLAYDDIGNVEYKNIFALVHASPLDRTRAFVLAMENNKD